MKKPDSNIWHEILSILICLVNGSFLLFHPLTMYTHLSIHQIEGKLIHLLVLYLPSYSVPISTLVVSSIPAYGESYLIQLFVIKSVISLKYD